MSQLHDQFSDDFFDGPEGIYSDSDLEPEEPAPPTTAASPKNFEFSPPKTLTEGTQKRKSSARVAPKKFAFESPKDIVEGLAASSSGPRVLRTTNRRPWTSTSSESSSGASKKPGRAAKSTKKSPKKKSPVVVGKTAAQKRKNGRFVKEASGESSESPRRASADSGVVDDGVEHSPARAPPLANDVFEDDIVKDEPVVYEYEAIGHREPTATVHQLAQAAEGDPSDAMNPVIMNSCLVHTQMHGVIVSMSMLNHCNVYGGRIFGPIMQNQ